MWKPFHKEPKMVIRIKPAPKRTPYGIAYEWVWMTAYDLYTHMTERNEETK